MFSLPILLRLLLCIVSVATFILEIISRHKSVMVDAPSIYKIQSIMVIVACVIHIGSLMMMIVKLQQWKRIRLLLIGSFNIMIISITVVMRGQYDLFHQNVYFNTTSILVLVLLVGWLPTTFSFPATHNVTPMPPFILRKTTETLPIYSKLTPPPPYKESSSYLHQHQPIRISPLPTIV